MSDYGDMAQELQEHHLAIALANRAPTTSGVSAAECDNCEEPIEEGRRLALPGVRICAICAALNEQKQRFKRGH